MTLYNQFPTDAHRRVAGNLTQPRTVAALARALDDDPYVPLGLGDEPILEAMLGTLLEIGDVVNLGKLQTVNELALAPLVHPQAITLHEEKAAILRERAEAQPRRYLGDGDQWILSEQGLAKLKGPAPPAQIPAPPPAEAEPAPVELGRLRGWLRRHR